MTRKYVPCLDQLEDRLVPATVLDLTTRGAEGVINDALFAQTDQQPTGTGVMHSFLRLQAKKKNPVEHGYNTDARKLDLNQKPGRHTRSLLLEDAPLALVDGVLYREFLLDINQKAKKPKLSLDELRLYVGDAPDLKGYDKTTKQLAGLDPIYDMDALDDNYVLLNARLTHGSGSGDMFLYVPDSLFAGYSGDSYLYLYSKFGVHKAANAGFEEWGYRDLPEVTAPSSLSGFVYFDEDGNGERDEGESGIVGVTLILTGASGFQATVQTGADGSYSFTGLAADTYTIIEIQPEDYFDGNESVGTVNGVLRGEDISDGFLVTLNAGEDGINYNFGEVLIPPPSS